MNSDVPLGAKVCRGCQAEIEYGAPAWAVAVAIVLPLYLAYQLGNWAFVYTGFGPQAFGVVFPVALLGLGICSWRITRRLYAHRTRFKRWYR